MGGPRPLWTILPLGYEWYKQGERDMESKPINILLPWTMFCSYFQIAPEVPVLTSLSDGLWCEALSRNQLSSPQVGRSVFYHHSAKHNWGGTFNFSFQVDRSSQGLLQTLRMSERPRHYVFPHSSVTKLFGLSPVLLQQIELCRLADFHVREELVLTHLSSGCLLHPWKCFPSSEVIFL